MWRKQVCNREKKKDKETKICVKGSSINDVMVFGGESQGFTDDSTIRRNNGGGGSKNFQNGVTSLIDNPKDRMSV